jgi:Flp pilus assembly protein TadD
VRADVPRFEERMGLAWLLDGRAAEAVPWFERARRAKPPARSADLWLGVALQSAGRRDEARAAYTRALAEPATQAAARDSLASLARAAR